MDFLHLLTESLAGAMTANIFFDAGRSLRNTTNISRSAIVVAGDKLQLKPYTSHQRAVREVKIIHFISIIWMKAT
jgi:hypothetical protein